MERKDPPRRRNAASPSISVLRSRARSQPTHIHQPSDSKLIDRLLKSARASGSLNLSNRNLKNVPDEVYQSLDSVGEDEKWWEAVELQKLILAHNNIECLMEDLRNLTQLTVLNVSNKLRELPAAIGELLMLKLLDVSSNLLQNLPEEIGSATALVKL